MHHRPLPSRSLVRVPRQERAIDTVHAVLDAAGDLFSRQGDEGFTVERVASAAGISPGSMYQYFANRDMILAGIVERGVLEAEARFREILAEHGGPADGAEAPRKIVEAIVAAMEPHKQVLAALLARAPPVARNGLTTVLEDRLLTALEEHLSRRPGGLEATVPGGPSALYVAVNGATFALLHWLSAAPTTGASAHDVTEALVAMIGGALH